MLVEIVYLSRDGGNLPFCELVAPMYADLHRAAFIHLACDSLMASLCGDGTKSGFRRGGGEEVAMLSLENCLGCNCVE